MARLVVGAALLVAEAHVPGGLLGVTGGVALAAGAALAIGTSGGAIALVVAAILAVSLVTGAWLALATRKGGATAARVVRTRGAQRAYRRRAALERG